MADSKKYNGSTWEHSLRKLTTSTDTITTLPADIYADGNNATVGIRGNTVQSGTPTPDNPIMPEGCGDLETVGAKAGQYKIPISSANTTTPVYLGEVQTTRKIRKLVLTGQEEGWAEQTTNTFRIHDKVNDALCPADGSLGISNMYTQVRYNIVNYMSDGQFTYGKPTGTYTRLAFKNTSCADVTEWIAYLQQKYAAGTPVTVWYVLATPETGIVNEPLRKIGNYADTVSGISIPTITSKDTFDVDTTLKPSEVSLSYTGWHDATVEEWDGSQW